MASCHMATAGYCTEGASRKPVVSGRRASTKAGAASLLPVMCSCQILAIRRCLCRRRSTSTSTTSRIRSTTAPGMPASKATGSHDGDEGPADGGVLGGLGYSTRASPNGEIASVYGVYTPVPPSGARFQVMTEAVIGTCTHRMLGGSCWRWAGGLKVEQKHKGYICSSDAIALTEAGEQLHAEGTCTSL